MDDLYALSQIIKQHILYRTRRDEVLSLYYRLGQQKNLAAETLLEQLKLLYPELFKALQGEHALFKKNCEEVWRLRSEGVQTLCYGEPLYPRSCYLMEEPPLTLSYLGAAAWLHEPSLAIVGSREFRFESGQWMEKELSLFLEKSRPCVVSGGARGVDQKAHALALRHHLSTIVVLPSGLGHLYPATLKEWMNSILERGGCFLSEYTYEQKMHKHLFHHRNRLIAALGRATLLVEARRRSGTLITAHQSLQLGRPVWVVPGHPLDNHFGGSLDLLTEGAHLVRDAEDLLMYFSAENAHAENLQLF